MNVKEAEEINNSKGIEIQDEYSFFEARIVLEQHEKYKPLVKVLEEIKNMDYRGNCPEASSMAFNALEIYRKEILVEKKP